MKAMVVGFGSIGERHARILKAIGCDVSIVSSRSPKFDGPIYPSLAEALQKEAPGYVVISNKTSEHYGTLQTLTDLDFKGTVLIEKPIFESYHKMPANSFSHVYVAYNLRFHPVILRLKELISKLKTLSVQAYVGKYLPDWRPDRDYRDKYSAKKAEGGGVLRDLSHEIDYLEWMFGPWKTLTALGGHRSSLEIDSDDIFILLMEMDNGTLLELQLNYLDKVRRREIIVNTESTSLKADLVQSTIELNDKKETFNPDTDIQETYVAQHRAALSADNSILCSVTEALEVVKMIEMAEKASHQRLWVFRTTTDCHSEARRAEESKILRFAQDDTND